MNQAKIPFRFYTQLHLPEVTGFKASTIQQLLDYIKEVPGSCIYQHTHLFLKKHITRFPEPANDFARWVDATLGDETLSEKLASIDVVQFSTIRDLRNKIIGTIEDYIKQNPLVKERVAFPDQEFHFTKSISVTMPTFYYARNLREFRSALKRVRIASVYYHIFEARLRPTQTINDFSYWLKNSLDHHELADKIARLDPYTYTLEGLRTFIIRLIDTTTKLWQK